MNKKLLSHRIRGFGADITTENTIENLMDALQFHELEYIEIDVRFSKDKVIHVFHDPHYKKNGKTIYLHKTNSSILKKDGIDLFDDFIEAWSQSDNKLTKLCIDIKDFGCEEGLISILKKHQFNSPTYYITWIPETIFKLYELKVKNIYFSYYPTNNFLLKNLFSTFPKLTIIAKPTYYHLTGVDYKLKNYPEHELGYQRVIVTKEVPEEIAKILVATNGGVCIEKKFISPGYLQQLKDKNFNIWVFGLKNNSDYYTLAENELIDVVFCEDAKSVLLK